MTIRICVSIQPQSGLEAQRLLRKAEAAQVDFVEIRLDQFSSAKEVASVAEHAKTPLIATDHSRRSSAEKQALLIEAAELGFAYVDSDLQAPKLQSFFTQVKAKGARCIVSHHDNNKTPNIAELTRILEREISSGADVYKIVTTATKLDDNLTLLEFVQGAPIRKKPVCFAMGELGKMSRLLSPAFGSFFTFAALERGSETAPGQMTVQEMQQAYALLQLV